jgi:hypothetical protein
MTTFNSDRPIIHFGLPQATIAQLIEQDRKEAEAPQDHAVEPEARRGVWRRVREVLA